MRRTLVFLPGLIAVGPWLLLHLAGARPAVGVITGMTPPGWGLEAWLWGPSYVLCWLVAVVLGPPLLATPVLAGGARYIARHVAPDRRPRR